MAEPPPPEGMLDMQEAPRTRKADTGAVAFAATAGQDCGPAPPAAASSFKTDSDHDSVIIRFAGDSGDGIQTAGAQLTTTSALAGNDVATFPDYPAEIRAPKGTPAGVSAFQVQIAARDVLTPGDKADVLIAMNPAALKSNLPCLSRQGTVIVDEDAFNEKGLKLAGFATNPLDDGSLSEFQVISLPLTRMTLDAVAETGVGRKAALRCRNFFAIGLVYWMHDRDPAATLAFIEAKYPLDSGAANCLALKAGWHYGETAETVKRAYIPPAAPFEAGRYRNITGNDGLSLGLVTAAELSRKRLFYSAYPITPASDILHKLSRYKALGVRTFQAEDEIAAMSSVIGAAFGGAMAATASSGPGIALKAEAMGLAVMLELPLLVIDVQRGGPSTGLPTKPEQTDLLQVLHGRNGESPMPVLAAAGPSDCFWVVLEAWRIAVRFMTPVAVLSDAFVANSAEPWRIPESGSLPPIPVAHPVTSDDGVAFSPYQRDECLARPWAIPGSSNLMHRIGGLEKDAQTGEISYDPANHQQMVTLRERKIANIAHVIPPVEVMGPEFGSLLVLSWGGTFGACREAVRQAQRAGDDVAHAHLRHINPMPPNLGDVLSRYDRVLVPELNCGQFLLLLRSRYLVDALGFNKVTGKPFDVNEIRTEISKQLA